MATIRKRNNSYQIRVFCGLDTNGKRIEKYTQWKPDSSLTQKQVKKELERRKVLFEQEVLEGSYCNSNITLQSFAEQWIKDYAEDNLAPKTLSRNHLYLRRIYKYLGHKKLKDIKPFHLNSFYKKLSEPGEKLSVKGKPIKNGKLAPKTILEHHRLISSLLSCAVKWGLLEINVAKNANPPKKKQTEIDILDDLEIKQILALLKDEPMQFRTMIYLLVYTGMRRGELCGLEWKDISFETNLLRITRSSQYIGNGTIITKEPKTNAGRRTITISSSICDSLKSFKEWQHTQKQNKSWIDTDRLFTQADGSPIFPDTVSKQFFKFIEKHNIRHVTLHSLRHTNASLLVAEGIDVRTIAQRLGHSNTSTTLNIYTHALQSKDIDAAYKLDAALSF